MKIRKICGTFFRHVGQPKANSLPFLLNVLCGNNSNANENKDIKSHTSSGDRGKREQSIGRRAQSCQILMSNFCEIYLVVGAFDSLSHENRRAQDKSDIIETGNRMHLDRNNIIQN